MGSFGIDKIELFKNRFDAKIRMVFWNGNIEFLRRFI